MSLKSLIEAPIDHLGKEAVDVAPFVIAEAGVNHNGSLETAKQLVDVASEAGRHGKISDILCRPIGDNIRK